MKIYIIEGARGTGKSSLAQKIRSTIPEQTLINFTGFHDDDAEGLAKVSNYYNSWSTALLMLTDTDCTYIFDRFFFSEAVYSTLYKSYDFSPVMEELKKELSFMIKAEHVEVKLVFLTIDDKEELSKRLNRDKVPFGKAQENVLESLKQQDAYRKLFRDVEAEGLFDIINVRTDNKNNNQVFEEVKKALSL